MVMDDSGLFLKLSEILAKYLYSRVGAGHRHGSYEVIFGRESELENELNRYVAASVTPPVYKKNEQTLHTLEVWAGASTSLPTPRAVTHELIMSKDHVPAAEIISPPNPLIEWFESAVGAAKARAETLQQFDLETHPLPNFHVD